MSGRWFRFYADAMRNPKVGRLNDWEYRLWTELLSVAAENDGRIPPADDLKHVLKRRLDHVLKGLNALIKAGLIDALGAGYEPHHWTKFQYKSDTSTERVHKHRSKRNVSETPPEAETDTEEPLAKANGHSPPTSEKSFWDAAKSYLTAAGVKNPGALIGKWISKHGREATGKAITAAQLAAAVDPVAYIEKTLRKATAEPTFDSPC